MDKSKQGSITRDKKKGMLSGVFAGISNRYGVNLELLRIIYTIFTVLVAFMPGVVIYVICAIILPEETVSDGKVREESEVSKETVDAKEEIVKDENISTLKDEKSN